MKEKSSNITFLIVSIILICAFVIYSSNRKNRNNNKKEEVYAYVYVVDNDNIFSEYESYDSTYLFNDSIVKLQKGCCYISNLSDSAVVLYPAIYQNNRVSNGTIEIINNAMGVDYNKYYPEYFSPDTFSIMEHKPDCLKEIPSHITADGRLKVVNWCLLYLNDSPVSPLRIVLDRH